MVCVLVVGLVLIGLYSIWVVLLLFGCRCISICKGSVVSMVWWWLVGKFMDCGG